MKFTPPKSFLLTCILCLLALFGAVCIWFLFPEFVQVVGGLIVAVPVFWLMGKFPEYPKESTRCNGDCEHCPPHYGNRYGRRYYGKGHSSGCERGGNGGPGKFREV